MEKVVGFPRRDIHRNMDDAEFGSAGRNDRFLPGWYILPAAIVGLSAFIALGVVIFHIVESI